ncbi:uncharacterized protein LOC109616865 [Esox lucius]|uniref:uncharacterized protein LOC109616865 n=1 Tax=Esox lucius TaxID=8010 RepID=UPI000973220A|nr:uncharacterized protein LOC109616865 [Esox lucius]
MMATPWNITFRLWEFLKSEKVYNMKEEMEPFKQAFCYFAPVLFSARHKSYQFDLENMGVRILLMGYILALLSGHLCGRTIRGKLIKRPNCLKRAVSPELITELLHKTETLTNSLPRYPQKIYKRLLPKSLAKKPLGIWEINKILDVYDNVFNHKSLKNLYPTHYEDLLARLKHDVECCLVECPSDPKRAHDPIRKLEKTFQKMNTNNTYKAVGEFKTVLRWINHASQDTEISEGTCQ